VAGAAVIALPSEVRACLARGVTHTRKGVSSARPHSQGSIGWLNGNNGREAVTDAAKQPRLPSALTGYTQGVARTAAATLF
jgi:hypothetical protein